MAQTEMFGQGENDNQQPPTKDGKVPAKVSVVGENKGKGNKLKQGWFQTDRGAADFMWRIGAKNPQALPLLMYLVAHLERGSGGVMVSAATAAADLGVSARTIQNTIAVLKRCNFVQVLKSGNTNIYVINSRVVWMGVRGGRYATFNATIRLAEAEQDRPVDELIEENAKLLPIPQLFGSGDLNWDVIEMDPEERRMRMEQARAQREAVAGGEGEVEDALPLGTEQDPALEEIDPAGVIMFPMPPRA